MISKKITVQEILSNIRVQPNRNIWSVLVINNDDTAEVLEELIDGIEIFVDSSVESINVEDKIDKFNIEDIHDIFNLDINYFLLWGFDNWADSQWQQLDYLRSSLDYEKRCGLLLVSQESVAKMVTHAPNFSSWIDGKIFDLVLGAEILTPEECESRLVALREWTGLSDNEVIKKAEIHQLPYDPEYGEWLILLGRGDLIAR
jgi:hypothetical protein